eukprot:CAMPEP_0176027430 /NCGR_PEP_ID=MMETSP0120_2-20121206/13451_1 /TAXON_ID=160619 /ORGANISM="Kryptoperidinium foliaceum, Strain CCMP 1326" /LENGTH=379 /DNA_ID=CAMNT_0017360635 /DNA_START=238 /DNA_END=1378 /DNA_ORIENTATION=+
MALPLLTVHLVLFATVAWHRLIVHQVVLMVAIVSVPVLLTGLRLPTLIRIDRVSTSIVQAFEQNEPVAERFLQLAWCRANQDQRLFSVLLMCWYSLALAWQERKPPCTETYLSPMLAMQCASFRASSSLLLVTNGVLCICALVAPFVISRCADSFTPLSRRGLPKAMLDRLPLYVVAAGRGGDAAVECVICFDSLEEGEAIRRLPCGHEFHAICVDSWLSSNPTCPLRCHNSIWDAVQDAHAGAAHVEAWRAQEAGTEPGETPPPLGNEDVGMVAVAPAMVGDADSNRREAHVGLDVLGCVAEDAAAGCCRPRGDAQRRAVDRRPPRTGRLCDDRPHHCQLVRSAALGQRGAVLKRGLTHTGVCSGPSDGDGRAARATP